MILAADGTPAQKVNGNVDTPIPSQFDHLRSLSSTVLIERLRLARQAGMTFGGARDEYKIFGYDDLVTDEMYRSEYERGGIAGRIVDAFPNATWRGKVEVLESEDPDVDTEFEKAWIAIEKKFKLQGKFLRVDKLAGLGRYACLLIGAKGSNNLASELPKGNGKSDGLLFFRPIAGGGGPGSGGDRKSNTGSFDTDITIKDFETETSSPRFGLPKTYQLRRASPTVPSTDGASDVHWSRIIHVAEGLLDDEVYGQPALERVWNLLIDLRKVTGGGAEAFFLRANQGMQINVDKDMTFPPQADGSLNAELVALREQAELYQHSITRT